MNKACFFDRDGVVNEMVFDAETGIVHVPLKPGQVTIDFGITSLLKESKRLKFLNILISNQPNIALQKMTMKDFQEIKNTIKEKLDTKDVSFDKEYYCFHHPFSKVGEYKKICECRKPKIGLFLQAAKEFDIDLKNSWTIGDGVNDIIAGHNAGCKTILISHASSESGYYKKLREKLQDIEPDHIVKNTKEIIDILKNNP